MANILTENIVSRTVRRYRRAVFRGYVLTALVAFIVLAALSHSVAYFPIDLVISKTLQLLSYPVFQKLMQAVSYLGFEPQWGLIVASVLLGLFLFRLRLEALVGLVNIVGLTLLETGTKLLVARPRPGSTLIHVLQHLSDYSFPSGHVLSYTAFLGYLLFLTYTLLQHSRGRTVIIIFLLSLIILIAPSRIYVGEHWASDTLGGYLLGTIWLYIVITIYVRFRPAKPSTPERPIE